MIRYDFSRPGKSHWLRLGGEASQQGKANQMGNTEEEEVTVADNTDADISPDDSPPPPGNGNENPDVKWHGITTGTEPE